MKKINPEILVGIRMITEGNVGHHTLNKEVESAIKAGYAYDADPMWMMSDDYRTGRSIVLKDKGTQVAVKNGWLVKCKCCKNLTNLKYLGWCSGCYSSGSQYGFIEDRCGMHYIDDHPEVLEERQNRKNTDWLPAGVKRQCAAGGAKRK